MNDWLASGLGKGTCKPITPSVNPPVGQEESGSGRLFTFEEPTNLMTIVERVKKLIGLPHGKKIFFLLFVYIIYLFGFFFIISSFGYC